MTDGTTAGGWDGETGRSNVPGSSPTPGASSEGETARRRDGETGQPNAAGESLDPSASAAAREPAVAGDDTPSRSPAVAPSVVLAWLDARESPPPPDLRARLAQALAEVTAETVPGALAEGALACLRTTMAAPQARETALDLLAADALLTYALEAAAELGASTLREMVELYGPGALASLLPPEEGGAAPDAPSPSTAPGSPSAPGARSATSAPGSPGASRDQGGPPAPEGE